MGFYGDHENTHRMESFAFQQARKVLRPELFNRITETTVFRPLSQEVQISILSELLSKKLNHLESRLRKRPLAADDRAHSSLARGCSRSAWPCSCTASLRPISPVCARNSARITTSSHCRTNSALVPVQRNADIKIIEIRDGTVAIDGNALTAREARQRLGKDADLIFRATSPGPCRAARLGSRGLRRPPVERAGE